MYGRLKILGINQFHIMYTGTEISARATAEARMEMAISLTCSSHTPLVHRKEESNVPMSPMKTAIGSESIPAMASSEEIEERGCVVHDPCHERMVWWDLAAGRNLNGLVQRPRESLDRLNRARRCRCCHASSRTAFTTW